MIGSRCINIAAVSLILAPLLASAGWFGRIWFDKRSRRLDKEIKREDVRRKAIELSLRWVDPLTLAIIKAESVSWAYLFGRVDGDHYRSGWPKDLSAQLESLDLPAHLRSYLPEHTQEKGVAILGMFHDLYYRVLETDRSDLNEVFETAHRTHNLRKAIDELRMELELAHRSTFE